MPFMRIIRSVNLLRFAIHSNFELSLGSAGTCLSCGENNDMSCVINLIIFSVAKEFENRLTFTQVMAD